MKLLITEQDIRHIRGLYNLIMEDITPESGGTVKLFNYYKSGYYTLESIDTKTNQPVVNSLNNELNKVREFIKIHPDSIVSIKFISGESAIPNKDNEGKEGGKFLNEGELSKLRKKYLDQYLQNYFQKLKTQEIVPMDFELPPIQYEEIKPVTPWVNTPFCPENSTIQQQRSSCIQKYKDGVKQKNTNIIEYKTKYDNEQKSSIEITVKLKDSRKKCLDNMTIDVDYVGNDHTCNSAIYKIYIKGNLNKTRYGESLSRNDGKDYASLNNNYLSPAIKKNLNLGKYDNNPKAVGGHRFNKFIVTPEIASTLISDGSTSFIISAQCINPENNNDLGWGFGCHEGVGNILVTNGNGVKFPYTLKTPRGNGEVKSLPAINACGKKIG